MRSGRGLTLRIEVAKTSEPARRGDALFKAYETAIRAAAGLGLGACSNGDDLDANSRYEQQKPHSRLLE